MKNISVYLLMILLVGFISCGSKGELTSKQAGNLISNYLEKYPKYETGFVNTSKEKLRTDNDAELMTAIDALIDEGFIEIEEEKSRKKFLSKDSIWIFVRSFTAKALPFIVEQGKNKSEVKTIEYQLNEDQEIIIENLNNKSATVTAILNKNKTPFYYFGKDENPNSPFITEKFKLKYSEEEGWAVVK